MSAQLSMLYALVVIVILTYISQVSSFSPSMGIQRNVALGSFNRNSPSTFNRAVTYRETPLMASRGGGQGSTKIDKKTDIDTKTKPTYRDEIEKDWRLILHDDTVHTIQQVCEILGTCCPLCSGPRAYEVTLEVHMTGAGTVAIANKKIVDEYCKSLQMAGLSVSMAPDDDFESEDDVE